jgi:S1-C subfamily serine protease
MGAPAVCEKCGTSLVQSDASASAATLCPLCGTAAGHAGSETSSSADVAVEVVVEARAQKECPDEVEEVPWISVSNAVIGDDVFTVGNPASLGWTLSRGIVSQLRTQKSGSWEVPIIQTDASLSPGNSG